MILSRSTIVFGKARSAGNGTPFSRIATQSKNDCAAALRERLCGHDSALCFLVRARPLPAKHALIPATGEINSSVAIANLLGDDDLVDILEKMAESVDNCYRELNEKEVDDSALGSISEEFEVLRKSAYPHIRNLYNQQNA